MGPVTGSSEDLGNAEVFSCRSVCAITVEWVWRLLLVPLLKSRPE
jgi:hypothetical protein